MRATNQTAAASVPPRLARVLYRSLLRASHYGRHPQVFGRYGAAVFSAQVTDRQEHPSLALPDKASLVRKRLKEWFQNPSSHGESTTSSGLDARLYTTAQQAMLPLNCRQSSSSSKSTAAAAAARAPKQEAVLPIFDFDGVAALPGETIQFVFLEPRYLHLGAQVRQSQSQQFLLRSSPHNNPSATLLKLVSHIRLPGNMMAVACLGGPRIKVLKETVEHVPGKLDPALAQQYGVDLERSTQLAQAIHYEWQTDDDNDVNAKSDTMTQTRQYILDMLHYLLPLQDSNLVETLTTFGLPPIDPEAFSFWALRYVVAIDDIQTRLEWSHNCRNTVERLEFVVKEMEAIYDLQVGDKSAAVSYA